MSDNDVGIWFLFIAFLVAILVGLASSESECGQYPGDKITCEEYYWHSD